MQKWYLNLRIGGKLALGFGVCLLFAVFIGGLSLSQMLRMNRIAEEIAIDPLPGTALIGETASDIKQYRLYETDAIMSGKARQSAEADSKLKTKGDEVASDLTDYEKTITKADDRQNFETLKHQWEKYTSLTQHVPELVKNGQTSEATSALMGEALQSFFDLEKTLTMMVDWNKKNGERLAADAASTYRSARFNVLALLGCGLLLAVLMAGVIARYITGTLARISQQLTRLTDTTLANLHTTVEAMAQGDLTGTLESDSTRLEMPQHDEFGRMAQTFDTMLERFGSIVGAFQTAQSSLRGLIQNVKASTMTVLSTSEELSAVANQIQQSASSISGAIREVSLSTDQSARGSQEVAVGSEQQARSATTAASGMSALEQDIRRVHQGGLLQRDAVGSADSSMKQTAEAVDQVARAARQMETSAHGAETVAQDGEKAVQRTVASMSRIHDQVQTSAQTIRALGQMGQQIGSIIGTIDEISEQTNLLALNATIEAARAGEHGKGFAVVAEEVRKLAERARNSTREIGSLIVQVRQEVENAVRSMEASQQEVNVGAAYSEEAGKALEQMLVAIRQVAQEVDQVMAASNTMTGSVETVLQSVATVKQLTDQNENAIATMTDNAHRVSEAISSVAAVTEEAAAAAEELSACTEEVSASAQHVSATVEQQTASIESMTQIAQQLNTLSAQLQDMTDRFRVDATRQNDRPSLRMAA